MKSFSRIAALGAVCLALFSCGKNTSISGVVRDGAEKDLVLKLLDVNKLQPLDTLKADAKGAFSYSLDLKEAQPEFIYLYYGDRQIASMLLQKGDKVTVETDTLGAYKITGSEESLKLQKVENSYNAFIREMNSILMTSSQPDVDLSRRYIAYYRDRLAYVVANNHSLTVVPVLFQQVNPTFPVFSEPTDGILMKNISDTLKTLYPESRYVLSLEKEAQRRMSNLDLQNRINDAEAVGYIDMELPGIDGKNVKLSDVESKVTMIYFWAATAEQKMFNLDALMPLYEEFHPKGFEIYAVSLNMDKTEWASAIRAQKLPWVNVCDIRGVESPYIGMYGVTSLPMVWFIVDGEIDARANVSKASDIREYLRKKL